LTFLIIWIGILFVPPWQFFSFSELKLKGFYFTWAWLRGCSCSTCRDIARNRRSPAYGAL